MHPVTPSARFVRLARLAAPKMPGIAEDFFTETLAAALEEDPGFQNRFISAILKAALLPVECSGNGCLVQTQVSYPGCRLDLVLTLQDGRKIGVENKVASNEGEGQLSKYLQLDDLHHIAFIAPTPKALDPIVCGHAKFLCPKQNQHFLWRDFYSIVASADTREAAHTSVRRGLLGLFDYLGYAPPLDAVGDVGSSNPSTRSAAQKRMDQLLAPARAHVYDLGFGRDGHWAGQITTTVWRQHLPSKVWIDGVSEPGVLSAKLYYPTSELRDQAQLSLSQPGIMPTDAAVDILPWSSTRKDPDARHCLKVVVSTNALLLNETEPREVGEKLANFVKSVIAHATLSA